MVLTYPCRNATYILLLLADLFIGKTIAPQIEFMSSGIGIPLGLGTEGCLHFLPPIQATTIDEVAHQVTCHLIYVDLEMWLSFAIACSVHSKEVLLNHLEFVLNDILGDCVLKLLEARCRRACWNVFHGQ